jgi:hypothetical protein
MKIKRPGLMEFSLIDPDDFTYVPAGKNSKYDPDTFPLLAQGYAREGLNNNQIAEKLGISKPAFYKYMNLYVDFANSVKNGRKPVNIEMENAIIKAGKGYRYKEKTNEAIIDKETGEILHIVRHKVVEKEMPPNVNAATYWLENRDKSKPWNARQKGTGDFIDEDLEIIIEDVED